MVDVASGVANKKYCLQLHLFPRKSIMMALFMFHRTVTHDLFY